MAKHPKDPTTNDPTFHQAMSGVKQLKHNQDRIRPAAPKPKAMVRQKKESIEETPFDESSHLDSVTGSQLISFHHPGIQHKTLRKMRKGQYTIEAVLDLHGMKIDLAEHAINQFLVNCVEQRLRHVLIIHGKGHAGQLPLLKNKLNHWLRHMNCVLAFCSASPFHGGSGALYVLLKQGNEEISD